MANDNLFGDAFDPDEELEGEDLEDPGPVMLVDEDGEEHPFQLLTLVPYEGEDYAVLVSLEEGADEDEVIILRTRDEGDDVVFEGDVDEDVLERVFEIFQSMQEDEDDSEA